MVLPAQRIEAARMVQRLAHELRSAGYPVLPILDIGFNDAQREYGHCQRMVEGGRSIGASITLSERCWEEGPSCLKSTILHELVHAIPDTHQHDAKFRAYAKEIGAKYGLVL